MSKPPRVTAVVVTRNRKEPLHETLWALKRQTTLIHDTVVVDNASDDGTAQLLEDEFGGLDVVTLERSIGRAGGYAAGLARAVEGDADVVWMMDDESVPEPGALAALLEVRATYTGGPLALVASKVVWTDGRDDPMTTPSIKSGVSVGEQAAAKAVRCVPIRAASFISILVDAAIVRERGLPQADYFLGNDDFEFTTRTIRGRRALYCPTSVVVRTTQAFASTDDDPAARFYYDVRDPIWMLTRSRSLSPKEKAVYAASTLRRWTRTLSSSSDKADLARAAGRGAFDGIRTKPRPAHVAGASWQTAQR